MHCPALGHSGLGWPEGPGPGQGPDSRSSGGCRRSQQDIFAYGSRLGVPFGGDVGTKSLQEGAETRTLEVRRDQREKAEQQRVKSREGPRFKLTPGQSRLQIPERPGSLFVSVTDGQVRRGVQL